MPDSALAARCILSLAFILFGAVACGSSDGPSVTVRDETGVRVTTTRDTPTVFAEVEAAPSLSIGGADASGPTQFFQIQNILVDARDRIWVADGGSGELRIFQPDGSHWKTLGGKGDGPGEFLQIRLLGRVRGDSVLVGDARTNRLTVFDAEGAPVRSEQVPPAGDASPRLFDVFEDGSLLGQVPRVLQIDALTPGQIIQSPVELVRMSRASAAIDTYGDPAATGEGPLWLWTGRGQVPLPFTINASFDVGGDEVYLVSGPVFEVRVLSENGLDERFGVARPSRPVTDEDLQAYAVFVDTFVPEDTQPEYLMALNEKRRPEILPAYDRVLVGPAGFVWAQVYDSDPLAARVWDVFDGDRTFVGQVSMPDGFQPMVVLADAVVGVWFDELGAEYVRGYDLSVR